MEANEIVFWFSIVVVVFVAIWAVLMIRAYNKAGKKD